MTHKKKRPPVEVPHTWRDALYGETCRGCGYPFEPGDPVRQIVGPARRLLLLPLFEPQ